MRLSPSTLRYSHDPLGGGWIPWVTESVLNGSREMTLRTHRERAFHRLAVSYRPRLVPTSYRPATKNICAVSFIPLRLEVSGRAILVWGRKYMYITHQII